MTIDELYDACEVHDWYHAYSDCGETRKRGQQDRMRLKEAARELGDEGRALYCDWLTYIYDEGPKPKKTLNVQ